MFAWCLICCSFLLQLTIMILQSMRWIRIMPNVYSTSVVCVVYIYFFFFSFFFYSCWNASFLTARRDLDREAKACTHKHTLTGPPVAACHWRILCCQSVAEAADNSCHFTLVAPGWNSFIPFTDCCSPHWSSSEFILPLSIPFCCTRPFFICDMLLWPKELSRLLLSSGKPIALRWERVEEGGGFYKLNWTQKQLKTRALKMDLRAVLNAWPPLEIHFL